MQYGFISSNASGLKLMQTCHSDALNHVVAMVQRSILSRRQFLSSTGIWLGASAMGYANSAKLRTISLIHTTDLHGHILPTVTYGGHKNVGGFARCVTLIRRWRLENPDSLLLDLGDVFQGTAESLLSEGNLMIRIFNRLNYDAWTLGNHDFDWGPEVLEKNLTLSQAPILTGNLTLGVRRPGNFDGAWKKVLPWMMKEIGGFKIALIGLVTPGLPYWLTPETLGGVMVTDPAEALARSVAEAKDAGADAIVVMGHMGWRKEDDFANPLNDIFTKVRGVDLYLGGHTHQHQPSLEMHGVLSSQAGYFGIHCGKVDLTFDEESRKLVAKTAITEWMDDRFEEDAIVLEMAQPDLKKSAEQLARKLGTATRSIAGSGRGSRLVELFCECFAEALQKNQTPVDGIFHGTFSTGDLPPGEITVADCWKLLPYENLLITAKITAAELLEIIQEDWRNPSSDRTLWPLVLAFDETQSPVAIMRDGKIIPTDQALVIGFNSYDGQSAGRTLMRMREIISHPSAKRVTTSIDTRSALMDGILARKEIF